MATDERFLDVVLDRDLLEFSKTIPASPAFGEPDPGGEVRFRPEVEARILSELTRQVEDLFVNGLPVPDEPAKIRGSVEDVRDERFEIDFERAFPVCLMPRPPVVMGLPRMAEPDSPDPIEDDG